MPRDASGNFAFTPSTVAPAVTLTAISATDFNAAMDDIAAEIQDSLSRSGKGGLATPMQFANGSDVEPSVTFTSDTDTGVYRVAANQIGIAAGGSKIVDVTTTGATVTGDLTVTGLINGGAAAPVSSSSCGVFTTTSAVPSDVTNLTVTITTQGRPVMLSLQPVSTGGVMPFNYGVGSIGTIDLIRDGVKVASFMSPTSAASENVYTQAGSFLDVVVAGTYVYKIQASTTAAGTLSIANCILVAVEL